MNDRFKFRVWNQKHNFYCNQLAEMCINYNGYCFDNGVSADYFEHDGFVIEQCTGLKDTNDNLIYENDIVEQSPSGNKYKIIWIDTDCGWGLENAQTGFIRTMNCFDGDELEIIGNVHEQTEQKDK